MEREGIALAETLADCRSTVSQNLETAIANVAQCGAPVLIHGESGTGKGWVARRIHALSQCSEKRIAELSCAAVPHDLFINGQHGIGIGPHWGDCGSIVFVEIADLPLALQSRFVKAFLNGRYDGVRPRIIVSSSRNLEHEVAKSRFREDLYYRISALTVRIPPLRQRKEDIPILLQHFLTRFNTVFGNGSAAKLSSASLRFLSEYSWPGNLRELEDAAKTIAAIGDEQLAMAALRSVLRARAPVSHTLHESVPLKEAARAASRQAERELILQVLSRTQGNRKRAAQELRVSYKALLYKLKDIGPTADGPGGENE